MDAISDLTSRAISFITAVQTTLLNGEIYLENDTDKVNILTVSHTHFEAIFRSLIENESLEQKFGVRAAELVWISNKKVENVAAINYSIKISTNLIKWIYENRENGITAFHQSYGGFPTPYNWRIIITKILYDNSAERLSLAKALEYLPIQIILALGGGGLDVVAQRILQMWGTSNDDKKALLNEDEIKIGNKFKNIENPSGPGPEELLQNNSLLLQHLIQENAPLSFELIFNEELKEIERNRNRRQDEQIVTGIEDKSIKFNIIGNAKINDPFAKVREMEISALAFSGGGIRSATFNLGILQGLAGKNLIGTFDYLSTVSGGGYIGSWLASWIKREESVVKVSNRLCPDKSPDPAGSELMPIKWLRMFSNYFAPNASIMSVDSWTVGITWLRNTLLNQLVILLLILAILFSGNLLFVFWHGQLIPKRTISWEEMLGWSALILVPVSFLAGMGMYAYHKENFRKINIRRKYTNNISLGIIAFAIFGSYFISAWLSITSLKMEIPSTAFYAKITFFAPAGIVAFFSLLIVGFLGNYIYDIKKYKKSNIAAFFTYFSITLFSAIFGLICLAGVSVLLENIHAITIGSTLVRKTILQFIFGIPLTLEVFTFTVIARMALMGKFFPDERREWWGRIGAHIHRISFLWILVSAAGLLGWPFLKYAFNSWAIPAIAATAGGWIALVGFCVKAAFSAKTTGAGNEKGAYSTLLNVLGKIGPYLFIAGLLILLPALTNTFVYHPLLFANNKFSIGVEAPTYHLAVQNLIIMGICAGLAFLLARQLGVNEFSMYNFYKNRLVRAYLGGTRRSTERQQTANPFTGFDSLDDEKLCKLKNEFGYYGPYPILNCALNASQGQDLDRQDRKAESFIFSPLFCGFDFSMARSSADKKKSYDYSFRETKDYAFKDEGPTIGTAMAISGAAVNPNQGYHSSPATAFLLTIFNAQMGRWLGNPRKNSWRNSDPANGLGFIIYNLVNNTSTRDRFIALSDGGHFDNMGLYEMVRRKCPYIILCDAEQDNNFTCEGLASAIRRCRIDFGAEILIDISKITDRSDGRHSKSHFAIGEITYVGDNLKGVLLYIKSSIMGNEPVDVYEYAMKNKTFPHQTTADQFFDEEQFESYRKLGLYIAGVVLSDKEVISKFKFNYKSKPEDENVE
ncbi:MAG: patatin-like phospholipase family protein [Ginsengibacter sp.]